jgi:hypothetical protein
MHMHNIHSTYDLQVLTLGPLNFGEPWKGNIDAASNNPVLSSVDHLHVHGLTLTVFVPSGRS